MNIIKKGFLYLLANLSLWQWTLIYVTVLSFVGSGILIAIESGNTQLSYIDAWFLASSAISVTGLITIDFSKLFLASQAVVLVLVQLGGVAFTTLFPVVVRRYQLKKKFLSKPIHVPPGTAVEKEESVDEFNLPSS